MGKGKPIYPRDEISKLLRGGKISVEDQETINTWYYASKVDKEEIQKALNAIDSQVMLESIHHQTGIERQKKHKAIQIYLTVAATFLLILLAGWGLVPTFFYNDSDTFEANLKIVETFSGERKKGLLPDGSTVFLKENSSISYEEDFKNGRTVSIKGEVFFKVQKSDTDTFKVRSNLLEAKVLGTEFLVSDKRHNSEIVLVKSGKVSVTDLKNKLNPVILEKNQKARWISNGGKLNVSEISNEEKYFSWLDGTLVIDRANISSLAIELEDWFGVEVTNLASDNGCLLSGAYHKMTIEQVLETINYSMDLNYEYNEGKLIIKKMQCKSKGTAATAP